MQGNKPKDSLRATICQPDLAQFSWDNAVTVKKNRHDI